MYLFEYSCPICASNWVNTITQAIPLDPYRVTAPCPSCCLDAIEPSRVQKTVPVSREQLRPQESVAADLPRKLTLAEKEQLRQPLLASQCRILTNMVDMLNSALAADPVTISKLAGIRIPCNQKLMDHCSVQIGSDVPAAVSLVGIINAMADAAIGLTAAERYARSREKAEALGLDAANLRTELFTMSSGYIGAVWDEETQLLQAFKPFDPVLVRTVDSYGTGYEDPAVLHRPASEERESRSDGCVGTNPRATSVAGGLDSNAVGAEVGRS